MINEIIELFKVVVLDNGQARGEVYADELFNGYVTDFVPTPVQKAALRETFKPIDVKTLYSVEERRTADLHSLLHKQVLHYFEVYGLGQPGRFNLEVDGGTSVTLSLVRGINYNELQNLVQNLIYANAPIKDTALVARIIQHYSIDYDINRVQNNELRVILFDHTVDTFSNGDDFVRWVCFKATQDPMLIKSKEVIAAVSVFAKESLETYLLERHANVLAEVFNRHKRLILAMKTKYNRTAINKISRLSKARHVPLQQAAAKTFIADYLAGRVGANALDKCTIRDKMKFLNLLEYKMKQNKVDVFVIRNGKMHVEDGRKVYPTNELMALQTAVLQSLEQDLAFLKDRKILVDPNVDYGLPISRKQTLGNLPFGTKVSVNGDRISSGIYWENEWGAHDLDLSAMDLDGNRTGWGAYSGYDRTNPVEFSGDVTSAPDGAMEFLTSSKANPYGLFVNIYNGSNDAGFKLVVGTQTKTNWIGNTIISERATLPSKECVLGFVRDRQFIVYAGRLSNAYMSGSKKNQAILNRATAPMWTIMELLAMLNVDFDTDRKSGVDYDHDLSYKEFTFDKLEALIER